MNEVASKEEVGANEVATERRGGPRYVVCRCRGEIVESKGGS